MLEEISKNNEIIGSFRDCLKNRVTSPIYGIFLISWAVFHWELIYTAFFVSEQKIWEATGGMLKNEYLKQSFFDFSNPSFYIFWVLPFVVTWLVIWKFPKWLSIPAFKKDQESGLEKKKIKLTLEKELEKVTKELEKEGLERLKITKEKKQKEKEIEETDPTVIWQREFDQFVLNQKNIEAVTTANKAIYETEGKFTGNRTNVSSGYNTYLFPDSLSRLDTLGLIKIAPDKRNVMEFTEKGKYFIRRLQGQGRI